MHTKMSHKENITDSPSSASPPAVPSPYADLKAVEAWVGPRRVFENLSLRLFKGEHTVVLGPNGSGKSSLIRLLSREIYPVVKRGSWLRLFGDSTIDLWQLRSRMGVFSQDHPHTYRGGTKGIDVVLSGFFGSNGMGRNQLPAPHQRLRGEALMERMGLAHLAPHPFQQLSQGEKRRLLLARSLVHDPEVLVLDEPTNGLDIQARHQLLIELGKLARGGTTLLLVTHRIEEIPPEIQRTVLLKAGRVEGDGPTDALLQDQPLSQLFELPLSVVKQGGYTQALPA